MSRREQLVENEEKWVDKSLDKFLENPSNVLSFNELLKLNKIVKEDQGKLKKLRETMIDIMVECEVHRLAGEVDGETYTVTLSHGGNSRHNFDIEEFKNDYPELYKKYSRYTGVTPGRLTIKTYETPKNPCHKCKYHKDREAWEKCERCGKHKNWLYKKEETEHLIKSLNRE